jgi:hypothetical protein
LIHERHFTRAEAEALLPTVEPILRELRTARDRLTDAEAHQLLADTAPTNGGGAPGREVGEGFLAVRRLLGAVQEMGIVVRDIDRGLIDFPALIDGEEIYLCWQFDEDGISWWHDLESGFGGRQPLDE